MNKKDTSEQYEEIKKLINNLEDKLCAIKEEVASYVINFGKYKGKTLAEIACMDIQYYCWLKQKDLIPYTINFPIDYYVHTKIRDHVEHEIIAEYMERKEEQGYVGRYII